MADTKSIDTTIPPVIWAQRRDKLLITIQVEDAINPKIEIDEKCLNFSAVGGATKKTYQVTVPFYKEVDPVASKKAVTARKAYFEIKKKEDDDAFWPRLIEGTSKVHWLKTDFNLWQDEDDSDTEVGAGDTNNMDLEEMMKNMGGVSNMNGEEAEGPEDDSDDDEMPDLE